MVGIIVLLLKIVEVVVALCLIGIILMQQSKSGGGLSSMGGAMTESVFGAGAGNVLTKATTYLAAIFLANTLTLAVISGRIQPERSVAETETEAVIAPAPVEEPAPGTEQKSEDAEEPAPSTTDEAATTDEASTTDEAAATEKTPDTAPAAPEPAPETEKAE